MEGPAECMDLTLEHCEVLAGMYPTFEEKPHIQSHRGQCSRLRDNRPMRGDKESSIGKTRRNGSGWEVSMVSS